MTAGSFHVAAPSAPSSADAAPAVRLRRRELMEAAALGLLALAVFFFHLGSYGLWEPDEARYAEIAREMIDTGNFIVPHLNYVPYVEKPPLLYWTTSFAFHFLGINEFAARVVPALSALAGAMLTLVGVQLFIAWIVMRVLEELSQREVMVEMDLQAKR